MSSSKEKKSSVSPQSPIRILRSKRSLHNRPGLTALEKYHLRETCETKWTIKQFLGEGRQGAVFKICGKLGCDYVVKVIPLRIVDFTALVVEVAHQELATGTLPKLAPHILDMWICKGLKGSSLKTVLKKSNLPSSTEDALFIVYDLIQGLNLFEFFDTLLVDPVFIHSMWKTLYAAIQRLHVKLGIIHGDLNPGNVMVELDFKKGALPTPKIQFIDFSMSKLATSVKNIQEKITDFQNDWFDILNYLFRLPNVPKGEKFPTFVEDTYRSLWSQINEWKKSPITQPTLEEWNHWLDMWLQIDAALKQNETPATYNFENEKEDS